MGGFAVHDGQTFELRLLPAIGFAAWLMMVFFGVSFGNIVPLMRTRYDEAHSPVLLTLKILAGFVFVQVMYSLLTQTYSFDASLRLFLILGGASVGTCCAMAWPRWGTHFRLVAAVVFWLPFDTEVLKDVWLYPHVDVSGTLNLLTVFSFAALTLLATDQSRSNLLPIKYDGGDIRLAALLAMIFMSMAMPFGLATGFIVWHPQLAWHRIFGMPILLFVMGSLPEELLFRGLWQRYFASISGSPILALALISFVFGLTHWNNTDPYWDWRFMLLAGFAGIAYGTCFLRTQRLFPAVVCHTLVNYVWTLFFMK